MFGVIVVISYGGDYWFDVRVYVEVKILVLLVNYIVSNGVIFIFRFNDLYRFNCWSNVVMVIKWVCGYWYWNYWIFFNFNDFFLF